MSGDRDQSGRPLYKLSIAQLEGMFAAGSKDSRTLRKLARELQVRPTERAARLAKRVSKALAETQPARPEISSARTGRGPGRTSGQTPPAQRQQRDGKGKPAASRPAETNTGKQPVSGSETANAPEAILAAWTALEALSPQTYRRPEDMAAGDRSSVASLTDDVLPWEKGETPRKNRRLYYQVILGAIPLSQAAPRLIAAFGEEDEESGLRLRDKAAIAAVLVDRNGVMVEDDGISVSSFAWALPQALQRKLDALGRWPEIEPAIVERLGELLRRQDDTGNPLPLDRAAIGQAHHWLVQEFGLPADLVEKPSFAVRVHPFHRTKHHPDVALLNSFVLNDLARGATLVREGTAPAGLRRYLRLDAPKQPVDLLADPAVLEEAVAPAMMPAACWPSPGGHALVMLQQAAINLVRSELAGGEGVIAINGPPGTGKTTLLRDIVAATVLDRALAMAAFDDPNTAFTASGEKVSAGESASYSLYSLAPSLKGHEIVVASSNNKAVENISRELPSVSAIGRATEEFSYFRTVSDALQGARLAANREDDEVEGVPEAVETWGMIAAVLGNRRNMAVFQQAFWWDDERSFRLYLKAAKGDAVTRETRTTEAGAPVEGRAPAVIETEQPPLPAIARANWRVARERLLTLKAEIDGELLALDGLRRICVELAAVRHDVIADEAALSAVKGKHEAAENEQTLRLEQVEAAARDLKRCTDDVAESRKTRPGLVSRLFWTERWANWSRTHAPLADAAALAARRHRTGKEVAMRAAAVADGLAAERLKREGRLSDLSSRKAELEERLVPHRPMLGDRGVDLQLFAGDHETWNLTSPWLPDSLHRKREDLFIAALAVHRAFIDASARRVYHNLGALMDVFANGPPQDDAKRKLVGDLWSTLHLAVPVVSTTFASAERMLGALPAGSIGWLLIDEAGQAHPQAAVGAVMRAKRAIMVGDPLQIQPVVTMPSRLTAEICKHFKVDPGRWAAPEASAQSVADRASRFQAAFRSALGPRRVGIPLLVHRRCQEPMFGMFNRMAYGGQMVHAAAPRGDNAIGEVLGPAKWFDVEGPANSKWCPAEGEAVVGLLKTMATAGITKPDLFIVTPFRVVAQELRRRLEQERALFAALDVDARTWISERVGTIHTVQGREADAVILVLGAPKVSQTGARDWAARTPNVFNVAVSRAQRSFYVIGSRDAWSGVGHGQELASLPSERVTSSTDAEPHVVRPGLTQSDGLQTGRPTHNRRGPTI